jgi:hypothetical protein
MLCYRQMMRTFLGGLALSLALALPAYAQLTRILPANGTLGITGEQRVLPSVQINQQVLRLAPGGRITDHNNRTIVHDQLPAQAAVLFTLDNQGDISRIFILTPEELARIRQAGGK